MPLHEVTRFRMSAVRFNAASHGVDSAKTSLLKVLDGLRCTVRTSWPFASCNAGPPLPLQGSRQSAATLLNSEGRLFALLHRQKA